MEVFLYEQRHFLKVELYSYSKWILAKTLNASLQSSLLSLMEKEYIKYIFSLLETTSLHQLCLKNMYLCFYRQY